MIYFERHFFGAFLLFLWVLWYIPHALPIRQAAVSAQTRTPTHTQAHYCLISCGCVEWLILAQLAFFPSSMINWPLSGARPRRCAVIGGEANLKAVNAQVCVPQPWCRALAARHRHFCSSRSDVSTKPQREVNSDWRMSENLCAVLLVFVLLRSCQQTLALDPHGVQDKQGSQVKRRLSLQSTGERTPAVTHGWWLCTL